MEHTERQELLYKEGVRLLKEHGKASCVLFQRKLAIGYGAAREIVDRMLESGIATAGKDYTIILNEEGVNKMRNDSFNGMYAKDYLERVIGRDSEVNGNEEKPLFAKLTYSKYLDLAKQGYKEAFSHLERISANKVEKATSDGERNTALAERDFWETVQFMVAEYYYNLGELKYEKHLGFMLLIGAGCDVNTERGVKLMLADMGRTVSTLSVEVKTRAIEVCSKRSSRTGVIERLILDAIWKGDTECIYDIIEQIRYLGIVAEVMINVSGLFYSRIHDAKKEVKDEI